jgi:hypothetical protein
MSSRNPLCEDERGDERGELKMGVYRGPMNSHGTSRPRMFVGKVAVDLVDRKCVLSLIMDTLSASNPLAVAWGTLTTSIISPTTSPGYAGHRGWR